MTKQVFHTNTLGDKLRQLRDEKNLMQREVGAVIEVDGAFISKVENNEKPINRKHLATLSKFFKVQEDELQTLWLADKLRLIIREEKLGKQAIQIVFNDFNQQ
jgi:transcriptional regulator with XRE-family HTH domain